MSNKPTIVFVPGASHTPAVYDKVITILKAHGYTCVGLALPSVNANPPHEDFKHDVAAIRDCVMKFAEDGKDIVVVLHSYAGLPGGEALRGLGRLEREKAEKPGGVIRLVFMSAYVVPENFQPPTKEEVGAAADWIKVDKKTNIATIAPEDAKRVWYNDFSEAEGDYWASQLRPQSWGVFSSKTSYAAWRDIPSTFLIGENDQSLLNAVAARAMIAGAQQVEPKAFDVVESCDGGHCLMISRSEWTSGAIRRAAGQKV